MKTKPETASGALPAAQMDLFPELLRAARWAAAGLGDPKRRPRSTSAAQAHSAEAPDHSVLPAPSERTS